MKPGAISSIGRKDIPFVKVRENRTIVDNLLDGFLPILVYLDGKYQFILARCQGRK